METVGNKETSARYKPVPELCQDALGGRGNKRKVGADGVKMRSELLGGKKKTEAKAGLQGSKECRQSNQKGFQMTDHEFLSRVSVPSVGPSRGFSRL